MLYFLKNLDTLYITFYYYWKNNEFCDKISNLIVKDFPTECQSTYFVPPICKKFSLNNKLIPARDKLVNMWKNHDYENKKREKQNQNQSDLENDNNKEDKIIVQKNISE